MKGASDGADMIAESDGGVRVSRRRAGCLQLQIVEMVRSSSWSGERSELQLGEVADKLGPAEHGSVLFSGQEQACPRQ